MQKKRVKTSFDYQSIEKNLPKFELSETEKSLITCAIKEKKFNIRTRVKSVNSKADLCRNYREYEERVKLSIAQLVENEYKQHRLMESSVRHTKKFTAVFSIPKPKYDPSIVYGSSNNRTLIDIKSILKKL